MSVTNIDVTIFYGDFIIVPTCIVANDSFSGFNWAKNWSNSEMITWSNPAFGPFQTNEGGPKARFADFMITWLIQNNNLANIYGDSFWDLSCRCCCYDGNTFISLICLLVERLDCFWCKLNINIIQKLKINDIFIHDDSFFSDKCWRWSLLTPIWGISGTSGSVISGQKIQSHFFGFDDVIPDWYF